MIVLDRRTWTYLGINLSGALLWEEIAQGTTLPALVDRLCDTYGEVARKRHRTQTIFCQHSELTSS